MASHKYEVGQLWRILGASSRRTPFCFEIIARSERPGYKVCKIIYDFKAWDSGNIREHQLSEFSHKHLQKYSRLLDPEATEAYRRLRARTQELETQVKASAAKFLAANDANDQDAASAALAENTAVENELMDVKAILEKL